MMWRSTSFDAKGVATAHCLIDGCSYVAEYMAALKNRQVASVKRTAGLSFNPRIKTDKSHEKLPQQCGFSYYMFRGVVHGCLVLLRVEDPVLEALALSLSLSKGFCSGIWEIKGKKHAHVRAMHNQCGKRCCCMSAKAVNETRRMLWPCERPLWLVGEALQLTHIGLYWYSRSPCLSSLSCR